MLVKSDEEDGKPYVAKVLAIHPGKHDRAQDMATVMWFYRPEDAKGSGTEHWGGRGRLPYHGEMELFYSDHNDTTPLDSMLGTCEVVKLVDYDEQVGWEATADGRRRAKYNDKGEEVFYHRSGYSPPPSAIPSPMHGDARHEAAAPRPTRTLTTTGGHAGGCRRASGSSTRRRGRGSRRCASSSTAGAASRTTRTSSWRSATSASRYVLRRRDSAPGRGARGRALTPAARAGRQWLHMECLSKTERDDAEGKARVTGHKFVCADCARNAAPRAPGAT